VLWRLYYIVRSAIGDEERERLSSREGRVRDWENFELKYVWLY
jgi:hypothetical protein